MASSNLPIRLKVGQPSEPDDRATRRLVGLSLLCVPILQADPWATAIFFDEFNASGFKRTPYDLDRRSSRSRQSCFQLPNSNNSNPCPFGESLLAPVQEPSRCSALCWGHHGGV